MNIKKLWKNYRKISEVEYSNIDLKQYTIIDVRSRREFSEGHINGAINIPLPELNKNINRYVASKNKNILVYCQKGSRSKRAAQILDDMGYTSVFNLKGGIESI